MNFTVNVFRRHHSRVRRQARRRQRRRGATRPTQLPPAAERGRADQSAGSRDIRAGGTRHRVNECRAGFPGAGYDNSRAADRRPRREHG